jgi:hypothetical protein
LALLGFLAIFIAFVPGCDDSAPQDEQSQHFDLESVDYDLSSLELGISFPAVADQQQRSLTLPLLEELGVRRIRIGEQWKLREPTHGDFHWRPLDKRMQWATRNGLKVLLTIQSNGPDWACTDIRNERSAVFRDNSHFEDYVTKLLNRYKNQIDRIQFGNEWQSEFWYAGDADQYAAANNILFKCVQKHSPATKVVLGGFTTMSLRVLAGCNGKLDLIEDDEGNQYDRKKLDQLRTSEMFAAGKNRVDTVMAKAQYDLVDIHLYDDAENWSVYVEQIQAITDKPITVSEFGGPNLNTEPSSESYQARRLAKYIQTLDQIGIADAYYFKLFEGTQNPAHAKSGLIRGFDLKKKPSFEVFRRFVAGSGGETTSPRAVNSNAIDPTLSIQRHKPGKVRAGNRSVP